MLSQTLICYSRLFIRNINKNDIRTSLESSPQYPNLLSVLHTLHYVGLDVYAGQCDWAYLPNLTSPFLLHLKNKGIETLLIAKWDKKYNGIKIFNLDTHSWEYKKQESIRECWDGVVIYTNNLPIKRIIEYNSISIAYLIIAMIVIFFSCLYLCTPISIHTIPMFIGVSVSFYLCFKDDLPKFNLIDSLCQISSATDCNQVEKSSYSSIYGIKISCLALAYFISQILSYIMLYMLEINDITANLYFISTILILPISIYSLYGQIKIGKICPLCLITLGCVLLEAVIFVLFFKQISSVKALYLWCCLYFMIICIVHYIFANRLEKAMIYEKNIQLLKLKRKKEILYLESMKVDRISSPLCIGNPNSKYCITTILSPSCNHCKKLAEEILNLLSKDKEFRWNIVWGESSSDDATLIKLFLNLYFSDNELFIKNLTRWSNRKLTRNSLINIENTSNQTQSAVCYFNQVIERLNIKGFPQFIINDRLLSYYYESDDLKYILIDKTMP